MSPFELIVLQHYVLDVSVVVAFFVASLTTVTTVLLTD